MGRGSTYGRDGTNGDGGGDDGRDGTKMIEGEGAILGEMEYR